MEFLVQDSIEEHRNCLSLCFQFILERDRERIVEVEKLDQQESSVISDNGTKHLRVLKCTLGTVNLHIGVYVYEWLYRNN